MPRHNLQCEGPLGDLVVVDHISIFVRVHVEDEELQLEFELVLDAIVQCREAAGSAGACIPLRHAGIEAEVRRNFRN